MSTCMFERPRLVVKYGSSRVLDDVISERNGLVSEMIVGHLMRGCIRTKMEQIAHNHDHITIY